MNELALWILSWARSIWPPGTLMLLVQDVVDTLCDPKTRNEVKPDLLNFLFVARDNHYISEDKWFLIAQRLQHADLLRRDPNGDWDYIISHHENPD